MIGADNVAAVFGADEAKLAASFVKGEPLDITGGVNIFNFTRWATDILWGFGLQKGIKDYNKITNIKVAAKSYIINNVDYAEILFNLLLKSTKDWTTLSEDGAKKEIENVIKGSSEITKAFKEEFNKTKVSGLKNAFKYFVKVDQGPVTVSLAENKLEVFAPLSNTVFKIKRICT